VYAHRVKAREGTAHRGHARMCGFGGRVAGLNWTGAGCAWMLVGAGNLPGVWLLLPDSYLCLFLSVCLLQDACVEALN
jgi:hypothetical protein